MLTIRVIHTFEIPPLAELETLMSKLSDAIAQLTASTDAAIARVQGDVAAMNAKIADLQAKVDAGTGTAEDEAAIAAIQARIDALDPTKPDVVPPPDEPPAPTP